IILDKLEKIGKEGVKKELKEKKIPEKVIDKLLPVLEIQGNYKQILEKLESYLKNSEIGTRGINETEELFSYLEKSKITKENYKLDLFLARGLEYYTGPIFESVVEKPPIGSLTGGGRYDKLIGIFLGRDIPATGTTIGVERIIDAMTELSLLPEVKTKTEVLVTIFNPETKANSLQIAEKLRQSGFKTEIYFGEKDGLRDQIGYANSKGIPLVIIIGPEEIKQNKIVIKNLKSGTQESIAAEELMEKARKNLT
ncbi:MAG TPA: HisS family protein, partial [candidate division Zixibacteria bacterium]|nr:HisS family protein [candidate division Zixibacteria bacterium]